MTPEQSMLVAIGVAVGGVIATCIFIGTGIYRSESLRTINNSLYTEIARYQTMSEQLIIGLQITTARLTLADRELKIMKGEST